MKMLVFQGFLQYAKSMPNKRSSEKPVELTDISGKKLKIPPCLLWSFNKSKVCPQKMYRAIIEQVLERGSIWDIAEIIRFYGLAKVQEVALNIKVLNPKRVNLLSLVWDIPIEQFTAWNTRDWEKIYGGFLGKRNSLR